MFVENYRLDTMIGGQAQNGIPYPKISDEDWSKWKAFLPVKSVLLSKKLLLDTRTFFLHTTFDVPSDVCVEMMRSANYFEAVEIWRKREIRKDPIAVGLTANGERYLICRWGMDRLVPFETIKSRSWLYHIQNFGVLLVTSENLWLSAAAAMILGIAYAGTW
jgi:hypothetical protein